MQDSTVHAYTHTYVSRMRNVVQKLKAIDAFANIHTYIHIRYHVHTY